MEFLRYSMSAKNIYTFERDVLCEKYVILAHVKIIDIIATPDALQYRFHSIKSIIYLGNFPFLSFVKNSIMRKRNHEREFYKIKLLLE